MSTIIEKIQTAKVASRKAAEGDKVAFFGFVESEIAAIGKNDGNRLSTDEEAQRVVKKLIKNMTILMDTGVITDKTKFEFTYLESLLPEMVDQKEVEGAITELHNEGKTTGEIMKTLRSKFGGSVDMKAASVFLNSLNVK